MNIIGELIIVSCAMLIGLIVGGTLGFVMGRSTPESVVFVEDKLICVECPNPYSTSIEQAQDYVDFMYSLTHIQVNKSTNR